MSTKAQITTAINTKIRNKTPLVVKVEHADVEQLITDEMFPNSVKIQWNGTSVVDPIESITVNPDLATKAKITFTIYFTKIGNRVFYKGLVKSLEEAKLTPNLVLATFPTTLYQPLDNFSSYSRLTSTNDQSMLPNTIALFQSTSIILGSGLPTSTVFSIFNLEGSYKVAN